MSAARILLLGMSLAMAACAPSTSPDQDLFDRLSAYCGQAFEGEVTSDDPRDADFASERLVMHVRECTDETLRIPFHVGEDRSRTWVITRLPDDSLRLKHDHRHEDGSEDVLTQYGGDTEGAAGSVRADFPADAESQALFEREGIPVSMDNVWSITLTEDSFVYALDRPSRHFSVAFDLTEPVETPPAPWGAE
ncbi:hypothetical protein [Oceanicaulis sp. MMSF_3324]|uniref:hypothetical protein n=1 Tax=Oceanicaulis sp. MMSF_3324 TaxID=3046702 RepID=UPI00273DDD27|nr:hypothetical protein [Oceanicaulis sp. MMSF_3324]